MSDKDRDAAIKRGKAKADKQSKQRKGKNAKGKGAGDGPSVAGHPRAAAQVRQAKGWGGVGAFAIAGYLSYKAGIPPDQVGERALEAGVAGYLLAWACSVTVWRHLMLAELRERAERARAAAPAPLRVSPRREAEDPAKPAKPEPA